MTMELFNHLEEQVQEENQRRVLLILENLPVPADRRMWQLATSLKNAGYHVSVISPRPAHEPDNLVLEGIHLYRYPTLPPTHTIFHYLWETLYCWLQTFRLTFRVWHKHGIDVVHTANPLDTFWVVGLFYKLFGKKFVYEHRDLCPEMYEARFHRKDFIYKALVWLERASYRVANLVIEMNESYKQIALERGQVPPDKITIVRSGPRKSEFQPAEPMPELKKGKQYLVCYLGVMGPQDGADIFVQAAHYIVHTKGFKDAHFLLVGSGDAYEDVVRMAKELDLEDYTTFTGFVSDRQQLLSYLSTADVGVASDPENDYTAKSTMNKVLEFMAVGLPVIATPSIENQWSAQDALVAPENASPEAFGETILALLNNPGKRRTMSEFGRRRFIECLSWEQSEQALLSAYDRLFDVQS